MDHEEYMKIALEEAKKGLGRTNPNPLVGAVLVKDGRIIGKGAHERYGGPHAERNCINSAIEDPSGSSLYVTLEPCCHQGKQPPCTDLIIENKIGRVYVGSMDPNEKVSGKGVKILRESGIPVETGILKENCDRINQIFFYYIKNKVPFVAMKYAMTLDGKIATRSGDSQWISGEESRKHAHFLRKKYSSILVGIGTVLKDDPLLNCRIDEGCDPIRIIADSSLKIPTDSKIVKTSEDIKTIVATSSYDKEKLSILEDKGIEIINLEERNGLLDLSSLFSILGERGIDSCLVEGGGRIHGYLNDRKLVNKVYCYIGNKLFGGEDAPGPVLGNGFDRASSSLNLENLAYKKLGQDILIEGDICLQE